MGGVADCARHGRNALAFVCSHVRDAVRARELVATRTLEVVYAIEPGDPLVAVFSYSFCHPCWSAADRRFRLREAQETELDELSAGPMCMLCLNEVAVPSGLPTFRVVVES